VNFGDVAEVCSLFITTNIPAAFLAWMNYWELAIYRLLSVWGSRCNAQRKYPWGMEFGAIFPEVACVQLL